MQKMLQENIPSQSIVAWANTRPSHRLARFAWPADCPPAPLQARVYQASKCALSGAPLELPAVHFLCGHSFSMKSLGENDAECPLCAPQHRTVLDIRYALSRLLVILIPEHAP